MITNPFLYGFRVVGDCTNERRLINWDAAFVGHCADSPKAQNELECYLSAYLFAEDFKTHLQKIGSTKGFVGATWSRWLWFDIDREGDIEAARQDAVKLVNWLAFTFNLEPDELLMFLSGGKGFHLGLPTAIWSPAPAIDFHLIMKRFAEQLAIQCGVQIDLGVYDRVRCFRAPNSRHPKTGLHKVRLSHEELTLLTIEGICKLAETPREVDAEMVVRNAYPTDQAAVEMWLECGREVREVQKVQHQTDQSRERLNRATLDFIRHGASTGERHRALFAAAANLAEFGCDARLAWAILSDAALDCGLPPKEVRRQIICGLEHGRKGKSP